MKRTFQNIFFQPLSSNFIQIILWVIALCIAQHGFARGPFAECNSSEMMYETDGHYWTVLVVATLLKKQEAKEIAYNAEYPDNVINADGYCVRSRITFLYPKAQKKVHALTGGKPEYEQTLSFQLLSGAVTAREQGIAAHRLGDSYSHVNYKTKRMYPHIIGHLLRWKEPDKIQKHPDQYLEYVHDLIKGLGGADAKIDMTAFYYIANAGLSSEENSAILKAEYNLISNSIAFNIEKNQVAVVEKYLKVRLSHEAFSYVVHTNTDAKKRITTTIILNYTGYTANRILTGS